MENQKKVYRVNFFRKGKLLLGGLAVAAFTGLLFFVMEESDWQIASLPAWAPKAIIGSIALVAAIVFLYGLLSVLLNKVMISQNAITVRKVFKSYTIPTSDILRVDIRKQQVIGKPTMGRAWYTIITNAKSYELDSYDFRRLDAAMNQLAAPTNSTKESTFSRD